ncbi:unnamed protein product [Prunus armeniaca]
MPESARGSDYRKVWQFGASAGGCPFGRASPFGREEDMSTLVFNHAWWACELGALITFSEISVIVSCDLGTLLWQGSWPLPFGKGLNIGQGSEELGHFEFFSKE